MSATIIYRMYINGMTPDIEALYPSVSYPVSRGTHCIHSLFAWDHSETWTSKSMAQTVSKFFKHKTIV